MSLSKQQIVGIGSGCAFLLVAGLLGYMLYDAAAERAKVEVGDEETGDPGLETAKEAFDFMKAMGMRGMAVTIPHKFEIMPLLDKIDKFAQKVGAVNTVVCEKGKYVGYNTDVEGFAEALSSFAGTLSGKSAALLGDGGAAQAVKVALKTLGVKFKVFHRATPPQGYDILVNATPVDPIPDYKFTGRELVYDLRYVPETTPLMARAAKAGCRVENGFSMLKSQARGQQRHFTA